MQKESHRDFLKKQSFLHTLASTHCRPALNVAWWRASLGLPTYLKMKSRAICFKNLTGPLGLENRPPGAASVGSAGWTVTDTDPGVLLSSKPFWSEALSRMVSEEEVVAELDAWNESFPFAPTFPP
jgi:hypothetical protein